MKLMNFIKCGRCQRSVFYFSDFEIASKSNKVCSGTHFKESVNCEKSGKVFRRFVPFYFIMFYSKKIVLSDLF